MHSAPAVSFTVGRSRFQAAVLMGVLTLSASTLMLWVAQADAFVFRHQMAALLWLISALLAMRTWRQTPVGVLHWDSQIWTWDCGDVGSHSDKVVNVAVVLDGQSVLLLRLSAKTQPIWVWPEQRMAPLHWLALRRAVFAPQPSTASQDVFGAAP